MCELIFGCLQDRKPLVDLPDMPKDLETEVRKVLAAQIEQTKAEAQAEILKASLRTCVKLIT